MDLSVLALLVFVLVGTFVGLASGLVPGLHVNNIALIVAAASPSITATLAPQFTPDDAILFVAAFLAAASIGNGIAALLPSVFLGAPDSETALSVLPGHRLLAQGRGYEAVVLGARGAFLAVILSLALLVPFRLLLGAPVSAYDRLRDLVPLLLLFLIAILLITEARDRGEGRRAARRLAWAVALLLLSGLLGWIVLRPGFLQDSWAPFPLRGDSLVLFPLFTGLFGVSTLLLSARQRGRLPPQILGTPEPLPPWRRTRGLCSGALAGAAVSWFPGLGGANATVIAQLLAGGDARENDPEGDREFLFAAGAANAATTVFTFAALFTILRARSGVAAAVQGIADPVPGWPQAFLPPALFVGILFALLVSAAVSYGVVIRIAWPFAVRAGRVRYGRLAGKVATCLGIAVFLTTGPLGTLILVAAISLGVLPPIVGVRRVHLMGCLLVPLLVGAL